jgi:mgtE-like transporter
MVAATMLGAALAVPFILGIAYYASIASTRFGVDPDTWGAPIVASSMDFIGTVTLVMALGILGVT